MAKPITLLLHLYPPPWRERYAAEVGALLEQHSGTVASWADLLWSALDARRDPAYRTRPSLMPGERRRRVQIAGATLFGTAAIFVISYLTFLSDVDDVFSAQQTADPALLAANAIMGVMGNLALVACAAAAVLFAGITALRLGQLTRGPLGPAVLRIALLPAAIVILGMALEVIRDLIWVSTIWSIPQPLAVQMAGSAHRELWPGDWHIGLGIGLLLMTGLTLLAAATLIRGLRAVATKQPIGRE